VINYFLNCDNTELKRSSKKDFSVPERHRWTVVRVKPSLTVTKSDAAFFPACSSLQQFANELQAW